MKEQSQVDKLKSAIQTYAEATKQAKTQQNLLKLELDKCKAQLEKQTHELEDIKRVKEVRESQLTKRDNELRETIDRL